MDSLSHPLGMITELPPRDGVLGVALDHSAGPQQLRTRIGQLVGGVPERLGPGTLRALPDVVY